LLRRASQGRKKAASKFTADGNELALLKEVDTKTSRSAVDATIAAIQESEFGNVPVSYGSVSGAGRDLASLVRGACARALTGVSGVPTVAFLALDGGNGEDLGRIASAGAGYLPQDCTLVGVATSKASDNDTPCASAMLIAGQKHFRSAVGSCEDVIEAVSSAASKVSSTLDKEDLEGVVVISTGSERQGITAAQIAAHALCPNTHAVYSRGDASFKVCNKIVENMVDFGSDILHVYSGTRIISNCH
jgi:hypothetical protein